MNKERLLKLADHLEFGVLGHQIFNLTRLNDGEIINSVTLCKSSGCAIGECPIVFPEDWEFRRFDIGYEIVPVLKSYGIFNPGISASFTSAQDFFDITDKESEILFLPSDYDNEEGRDDEGKGDYNENETLYIKMESISRQFDIATKEDVAHQIRRFVELKEH